MGAHGPERSEETRRILRLSGVTAWALGGGVVILSLAGLGALVSVYLLPDFPGRDTFADLFMLNREHPKEKPD